MTNRISIVLFTTLTLLALSAWSGLTEPYALKPESRLWIDGKSTMRDFTCKAPALTIVIEAADAAVPALLSGERAFRTVHLDVAADRMDCANGTMNGHMLKALKAAEHPLISFQLGSYDLTKATDLTKAVLTGTLDIGGVQKPVTLPVDLKDAGEGALRVTGSYELNMRDYDLKPPSLMLGTMKVRDKVIVNFDLVLKN
ncbi:MAG TPA: YceI family protein [Gemmatimonadaceae bacterium]|nr:YceI family protein [Gemmatimonadaceae bacterium]